MRFIWNRKTAVEPQKDAPPPGPDGGTLASDDERKKVGALITGFEKYLQDNALAHPTLAPAITELRTAVAAYRSPQAGDPAAAIRRVLATIQAARKLDTLIPEP